MPAGFGSGIRLPAILRRVPSFLPHVFIHRSNLSLTRALGMGSQGPPRRPFCLRCSKPSRLCLCARIRSPPLDNPITVTILQHSLEKDHPLNSCRIAKLGLRNLAIIPVTDVNFQAQFIIRPLEPDRDSGSSTIDGNCWKKPDSGKKSDFSMTLITVSDDANANCGTDQSDRCLANAEGGEVQFSSMQSSMLCSGLDAVDLQSEKFDFDRVGECPPIVGDYVAEAFSKYSIACSPRDIGITIEHSAKPNISRVIDSPVGRAAVSQGFMVKKLQRKQLHGSKELQDFEEFKIKIPTGTALLFPSEESIGPEAVDFEVKQLIVLDGTWGKAKRMYHENPWLKLLPHLKIESGTESLYNEVRHQPKAGCLSTIESIVCAMKGLGGDMEGLDNLLEVFGSMVGDQRRCKDEKHRAISLS